MREVEFTKPINIRVPEYLYNYLIEITAGKISKANYIRTLLELDYKLYQVEQKSLLSTANKLVTEAPAEK